MKKIASMIVFSLLVAACTPNGWSDTQANQLRKLLRSWGYSPAMEAIDSTSYEDAVDCVVTVVQEIYPAYSQYAADTNAQDTLTYLLVECIADQIGSGYEGLAKVMPYNKLVNMGVLPSGLTSEQQTAFYNCLGSNAGNYFLSPRHFLKELIRDASKSMLRHRKMQELVVNCCVELGISSPMLPPDQVIIMED